MRLRSILFVPGDSERKIERSQAAGADALVLDLEDSVAPARKPIARQMVREYLVSRAYRAGTAQWVRINPLTTPEAMHDLAAVVAGKPAGILLPKADGPADVQHLSHCLDALEAREGLSAASIVIMPVATETARAPFSLGDYRHGGLSRLYGLTWGAEDLSAAIGASTNTEDDGQLAHTYRTARSFMLLAAKAAGVEAIETVYPDYRNMDGLERSCMAARREGFTGRFAIHPDQVATINAAFTPSADEVAFAEKVIAAFRALPDAGVVGVDGRMLDRPHLTQAERVLARRDAFAARS